MIYLMVYQSKWGRRIFMIKKALSIAMALTMAASLAGCGSSSTTATDGAASKSAESAGTASSTADGAKTKLTMTWRDEGNGEQNPLYQWFTQAYETYPDKDKIELDFQYITASEGDYFAKVALALQSEDTAPDIVCEDTFYLPSDVAAGNLTNLDEYVNSWEDWTGGKFYENVKSGVTADGSVYAVPYTADSRGIWFNKEVFAKAGLPEDWTPKTWQDILDACKTIKEKCPDVIPFWCNAGTISGEATSMQTYEELLYGTGEEVYEDGKWVTSSDNILKSLNFINDLFTNDYATADLIYDAESSDNVVNNYLPEGKVAMMLNGYWITGNYKETGSAPWADYAEKLGYAEMPTSEGQEPGNITMSGGWTLAIPSLSDEKDAAWDFIKWCMNYDNYLNAVQLQGVLSTRSDVAADEVYSAQPFVQQATDFLEYAYYRPQNDQYTKVTTYIQTMVENVASGSLTPEDAMAQYKSDVENAVGAENCVDK